MRSDIMGVGFDNITLQQSIDKAADLIDKHECGYAVTPNPEIVWMSRKDSELRQALNEADIVLPDGVGILYSAKILQNPLKEKVTGIDFGLGIIRHLSNTGGSVYLLGSKPGVPEKAAAKLLETYPGIKIAGIHHGYFDDDKPIIDEINEIGPDFLTVCLGAPKQEKWMLQNKGKLNVGLMVGLGGVLDVLAGTVKRAPEAWRKRNLEWLYRLLREPRRIKRQIKIPMFMLTVICKRFKRGGENER